LDTLPIIKVCVGYRLNGKEIDHFPSSTSDLAKVEPIYEEFDGWQTSTEDVRSFDNLPASAQKYVQLLEEYLDIPGKNI
jgi:adenylosuccinate synthase